VRTAAEFLDLLRLLRVAAGNPSLGVLSRRTQIPRTTLHDALNVKRSTVPPLELVTRLVSACGCAPAEVAEWAKAWRAVCQPNSAMTSPAHLVPRQLPAPPRLFTGREGHLADLSASGVTVISGVGGIGKTWLALRWAHDNLSYFPDGQLYVDLRGFDLAGEPMPVAVAVRSFLDALGVEAAAIPADLDAQVGLYRSVIAKRRMLIVLDNARDTAQVAPMLPGSPLSTVLVTSRRMLTGMMTAHGALPVGLEVLCDTEARDLLARHLGPDRLMAEPVATAAILTLCGGLPLALSTVAALAGAHPQFSLEVLAAELAEARLDALDTADLPASIRAVFGSSYRALEPAAAELFCLLGLTSGPDISLRAASALAGKPARKALKELHLAHLTEEYLPGRFRMHDLVRLYAAEQAGAAEQGAATEQAGPAPRAADRAAVNEVALQRMVDFFLQSALNGASILDKDRPPIETSPPVPGHEPTNFTDRAQVLAWFDAERFNLLAAQRIAADHSWHSMVWQLAWAMNIFHRLRGFQEDALTAIRAWADAAHRLADEPTLALARRYLGRVLANLGSHEEAMECLRQAMEAYERNDDLLGQAYTQLVMGWSCGKRGDLASGLEYSQSGLGLFRKVGHPVWTVDALCAVGTYQARLGMTDSVATVKEAQELAEMHDYREGQANSLQVLGIAHQMRSEFAEAERALNQALQRFRELGNGFFEGTTLGYLGDTHNALGSLAKAKEYWQQAIDVMSAQGRLAEVAVVQEKLEQLVSVEDSRIG
jgi:tetratricopeptide (TPR) repeat protein